MKEEQFPYLSDEELDALILEVEQKEMVQAPADLLDNLLLEINQGEKEQKDKKDFAKMIEFPERKERPPEKKEIQTVDTKKGKNERKKTRQERVLEFRRYKIRVLTSVAAALLILIASPVVTEQVNALTENWNQYKIEVMENGDLAGNKDSFFQRTTEKEKHVMTKDELIRQREKSLFKRIF